MRRFLLALIGIGFLAVAVVTLWVAVGPQPTEARTTGGVLYTQQEVASAPGGDLNAVVDTQVGSGSAPVSMPFQAEFASNAATDLSSADAGELQAAPETTTELAVTSDVQLTTDLVLSDQTGVAVAPLFAGAGDVPDGQGGFEESAAGYEQRVVELEWPATFQVGRGGVVRIKLKMLDSGALQPVAEVATNEVVATPILITDRYDTHDAFVTATISAPDFTVSAVSNPTQPLARGGEVTWRWTLESNSAQTAVIALGLSITWQPKPGQPLPALTNVTIWGQTLQVEVDHVFGLITVPQASAAGTVLAVLGFIAEMPLLAKFLEIFLDIFFGRDRRRREEERRRREQRRRRR